MRFVILRLLTHSELGMFHEYRRQAKEGSKQRAINFDWDVVDRVFPAAADRDRIDMNLRFDTDRGVAKKRHWLKRQEKNWRLEGNCPTDKCYRFVDPGCLFAMQIDAGRNPASGSWAVFPEKHEVSKLILADGESSRLASSAMIALHDGEGEHVLSILADARPDLFEVQDSAQSPTNASEERKVRGGKELPPNPSRLVQILSAVGHTLPSAIADLVDNAISADATSINIRFGRPDGGHGRWLAISDNGKGMTSNALAEAMRIGSDSEYDGNDLGKYGYGLKGASWSQAKVFTVVTKREGEPVCHLTWDSDDMDEWVAKSDPLEPWERVATEIGRHGTVVLWKDMRPPQEMVSARGLDPYSSEVMQLERHLGLVFHRFIEGRAAGHKPITISINGAAIKPNNPVGHPLASSYDLKTIRIPTETGDGKVQIQAYLLPSEDEITDYHRATGPEVVRQALDAIGLHGKRTETQGLFVYRHDRLIKWGGWHEMWATNDEKTKLARLVVNFDRTLDEALKVNISKQMVQLPQQLQAEIKKIAEIARRDSQKKYRKPAVKPNRATGGAAVTESGYGTGVQPKTVGGLGYPSTVSGISDSVPSAVHYVMSRAVRTEKFVWKVTEGITGARDLQISDLDENLCALVKRIGNDTVAITHLSEFLRSLDDVDAQKSLMSKRKP